jgi:hypothetical protein
MEALLASAVLARSSGPMARAVRPALMTFAALVFAPTAAPSRGQILSVAKFARRSIQTSLSAELILKCWLDAAATLP